MRTASDLEEVRDRALLPRPRIDTSIDPNPRQLLPSPRQLVAAARELLLCLEQLDRAVTTLCVFHSCDCLVRVFPFVDVCLMGRALTCLRDRPRRKPSVG